MGRKRRFAADTRGIEGLPVRLVIALVVGVASLSVMMNMFSELTSRHCPYLLAAVQTLSHLNIGIES